MSDQDQRSEIEDRMAEILDGDAPPELYEALAESDAGRDARHESEQAVAVVREAAADYVAPPNLEARVLEALDARPKAEAPMKPEAEP